jgi:hypothetical protein
MTGGAPELGPRLSVTWRLRAPPLPPTVAVGIGPAALGLCDAALRRTDEQLAALRGLAGDGLLCLVGEDLPWADGVRWLGACPEAPGLYLPTRAMPSVHPMLLARALGGAPPLAVLPEAGLRLPLNRARPVQRDRLLAWRAS